MYYIVAKLIYSPQVPSPWRPRWCRRANTATQHTGIASSIPSKQKLDPDNELIDDRTLLSPRGSHWARQIYRARHFFTCRDLCSFRMQKMTILNSLNCKNALEVLRLLFIGRLDTCGWMIQTLKWFWTLTRHKSLVPSQALEHARPRRCLNSSSFIR